MHSNNEVNVQENEMGSRLLELMIILVKWKKLIFWNVFVVSIAAIIISLLMDKWYISTASLLPPKTKSGLFGNIPSFSGAIKDISKTLGRLGSTSDEAYNYLAIFQSRTASEKMIDRFNLREVYEIDVDDPTEDVIDELENNVDFNVEDEGNITVKVSDKSPQRAADMANYYVTVLNEISTELGTLEARNNRVFVETRLNQIKSDLAAAEDSLKEYSEKYKVYNIEEQLKAALSIAADLNARVVVSEIELNVLKLSLSETHPLVQQAKTKLKQMKKTLDQVTFGTDTGMESASNFIVPFGEVPEVGLNYMRRMRDFEIQQKILEFIYPMYEQAKIEEQKDIPVVMVLDRAVPADRKSSPKRSLIVISAFFISLLISVLYVLIMEEYESIKSESYIYGKIQDQIINPLQNLFPIKFLFKRKKSR